MWPETTNSIVLQLIINKLPDHIKTKLHQPHKKREHLSITRPDGRIVVKIDNGVVHIRQNRPDMYDSRQLYDYCQMDLSDPDVKIDDICATIIKMHND